MERAVKIGTLGAQNANAVAITGGTITGITNLSITGGLDFTGSAISAASGAFYWSSRAVMRSPADATWRLSNNAETVFVDLVASAAGLTTTSGFTTTAAFRAGSGDGGAYADVGQLSLRSDIFLGFSSTTNPTGVNDTKLFRTDVGILGIRGTSNAVGGALSFIEQTAPAAPAANGVYLFSQDNGAGKTQLMARFATGVAQQVAIEP